MHRKSGGQFKPLKGGQFVRFMHLISQTSSDQSLSADSDFPLNAGDTVSLFFNYPNPFRNQTQIIYNLPETCEVLIKVLDIKGNVLKEWQIPGQSPGNYYLIFNGERYSGGIYEGKFQAQGKTVFISKNIKMIRVK